MLPWHQYLLGLIFVIAGANHFRTPKIYERIMPLYIPSPSFMVLLSGITEMIAGFLIIKSSNTNFRRLVYHRPAGRFSCSPYSYVTKQRSFSTTS